MSDSTVTPEWSRWSAQRQVLIWQALALSADVEPDSLGLDSFLVLRSAGSELPLGGSGDPQWLRTMCQRQSVLLRAAADSDSGLLVRAVKQPHLDTPIKLATFVDWARKHKWALPKDLKSAFAETPNDSKKAKPKGSKR